MLKYHIAIFLHVMFSKKQELLSDLIERKLILGKESSTGFKIVVCAVCNDHSERGGFKFEGGYVGYSCFNCGAKFKYEEGTGKFSRDAKRILEAFNISNDDLLSISNSIFFAIKTPEDKLITLKELTKVKLFTPEVDLPPNSHALGCDGSELIQEPIIQYLLDRQIDPLEFDMHFSLDKNFLRRVIIPFKRNGKMIYWQARAIDKDIVPRYKNCYSAKEAIIYGYDKLSQYSEKPLFVTEGVFDAIGIDGICILGSVMNEAKIEILKKTRRRIIFVLDRDKNGEKLGYEILKLGWELTFVDIKARDVNDSIIKFGKEFTAFSLMKNATNKLQSIESSLSLGLGMLDAKLRKNKWIT